MVRSSGSSAGGGRWPGSYGTTSASAQQKQQWISDQELVVLLFLHKCDNFSLGGSASDSIHRYASCTTTNVSTFSSVELRHLS